MSGKGLHPHDHHEPAAADMAISVTASSSSELPPSSAGRSRARRFVRGCLVPLAFAGVVLATVAAVGIE
jgi:hypothetical protein